MNTERVLEIFKEITTVPRESGHEEQIIAWLLEFARKHGLESKKDEVGNVLIIREASAGKEDVPTIVLQSHSDMVCEKNAGSDHDFAKDPIPYVIEDGWMVSHETTLGADCGIGMACALELLSGNDSTGRLEALFTVSEETGLDGAMALKPGFFTGKTLINLDSEDEGQIFVGCAGGLDTTARFSYSEKNAKAGNVILKLRISGCIGGHSGDDINKGRANAVQLLGNILYDLLPTNYGIVRIDGGNKRNAIAREAFAELAIAEDRVDDALELIDLFRDNVLEEYGAIETGIRIDTSLDLLQEGTRIIDRQSAVRLVTALAAAPHGVLAMSQEIPGFVETSTNLASVKMTEPGVIRIGTSQRSCVTASRREAGRKVEACFVLAGAEVSHESEYPGWAPASKSALRDRCVASYRKLFNAEPKVLAIHAGLECGLFTEVYPDLDMISIGPTLRGVHAPGERLELASLDKFTALLTDLVVNFK